MTRAEILDKAKECVCGQREQDYGKPEDNFQVIADLWSVYKGTPFTASDVSMMMALMKIARIKTGASTDDCFVDLAGYAACGGEIMAKCREKGYEETLFTIPSPSIEDTKVCDIDDIVNAVLTARGSLKSFRDRANKFNVIRLTWGEDDFKIGTFERWDAVEKMSSKINDAFNKHNRLSVCELMLLLVEIGEEEGLVVNMCSGGRRITNPCLINRLYGWVQPLTLNIIGNIGCGYTLSTSVPKKFNQNKEEN